MTTAQHHPGCTCEAYSCRFARDDAAKDARLQAEIHALLSAVPLPPNAITYEKGWELLDKLQALAAATHPA